MTEQKHDDACGASRSDAGLGGVNNVVVSASCSHDNGSYRVDLSIEGLDSATTAEKALDLLIAFVGGKEIKSH